MSKHEIPSLSSDLIRQLDEEIPHETPNLGESERAIFYRAGQRDLVDRLLVQLNTDDSSDPEKRIL